MKINTSYKPEEVSNIWFGEGISQTQYKSTDGDGLQMLLSDVSLTQDPSMFTLVQEYAANQDSFFSQFKISFEKLLNLGVGEAIARNDAVNTVISNNAHKDPPKSPDNNGAAASFFGATFFSSMAIIMALAFDLFL